jgi:Tfp pilus assembly pilus retraction ATPase PilT
MSFPAEIQGSIRAQLADCLVGVVCQRLDFLSDYQLRVPRCEVLTASSAAKGTIRAGQFSQIATVLQAGGEEGMWSFDRYKRWMAQKKDWVVSRSAAAMSEDRGAVRSRSDRDATSPSKSPSLEAPFEISIDEEVDLAEIAKKIDEGH